MSESSSEQERFEPSARAKVRTRRDRARYDKATLFSILDSAFICHVAFALEGQPYCIPTTYWREEERLFWHGSGASRMLGALTGGIPVCLTVTHLDALVLSRAAFGHAVNYRSAVVFGRAERLGGTEETMAAMNRFVERLYPGRSGRIRPPTTAEQASTLVLSMQIEEASAKIRDAPVTDEERDFERTVWAGLIPLSTVVGPPSPAAGIVDRQSWRGDVENYREGAKLAEIVARLGRPPV